MEMCQFAERAHKKIFLAASIDLMRVVFEMLYLLYKASICIFDVHRRGQTCPSFTHFAYSW